MCNLLNFLLLYFYNRQEVTAKMFEELQDWSLYSKINFKHFEEQLFTISKRASLNEAVKNLSFQQIFKALKKHFRKLRN